MPREQAAEMPGRHPERFGEILHGPAVVEEPALDEPEGAGHRGRGAAINIILAPWFQRRRGLAVGLAFNGATLGGVLVAPALIPLIGAAGLARALPAAALGFLALIGLAAAVMRLDPRNSASRPTATPGPRAAPGRGRGAVGAGGARPFARGASGACPWPSRSASRRRSACSPTWSRSCRRRSARAGPRAR